MALVGGRGEHYRADDSGGWGQLQGSVGIIYFGLPAQFWLNLQNDYDLRLAARKGIHSQIKRRQAG
jgi:hypothetical protein